MKQSERWQPTAAHFRALIGGLLLTVVAILARRPDVLVLATPLIVAAAWGAALRPTQVPVISQSLAHGTVREGQATTWQVCVDDPEGRIDDVGAQLPPSIWTERRPIHGQVAASLHDDGAEPLSVTVRGTRWGRRRLEPPVVVASAAWAAHQWAATFHTTACTLLTLPQPAPFDAAAPPVRVPGHVGVNRSPREGGGTEFAGVRAFQPGDRLRRIHWTRSVRTGTLHVTTTWADHDRQIVLLVDALDDVGESGGVDGAASSLDIAVRAASAIAGHYITVGDRVGLVAIGARGVQRVPAASGSRHLRRMLEVMATIVPARATSDDGRLPRGLNDEALVVMLSPLLSPAAMQRVRTLTARGITTMVIDCLPDGIALQDPDDAYVGIAWRIEVLTRDRDLRLLREAGVSVVPWRGPGSLDAVLRDLHRHGRAGGRPAHG